MTEQFHAMNQRALIETADGSATQFEARFYATKETDQPLVEIQ
jgi:hypothetical protein